MLRAVLMLLGIPYHAALPYRPGQLWIMASVPGDEAFAVLAEAIHLVRMPAFFLIAGWFAALLLERRAAGAWWRERMVRLGVPLVAAMLTIVPALNLLCERSELRWPGAIASFAHESATSAGYWVRHLWFLIVLIQLSSLAALAAWSWPALRRARWDAPLRPGGLLTVAALAICAWQAGAIEAFYAAGLNRPIPQEALRIDDLLAALPWFALGAVLARAPALGDGFQHGSARTAIGAVAMLGIALAAGPHVHPAAGRVLGALAAFLVARALLGAGRRWFGRPNWLVDALVAGSFTLYLVHLPVVILLVMLARDAALPVPLAFPLVCAGTLALSWGAWLVVRRSRTLSLLYAGRPLSRSAAPPAPRT